MHCPMSSLAESCVHVINTILFAPLGEFLKTLDTPIIWRTVKCGAKYIGI